MSKINLSLELASLGPTGTISLYDTLHHLPEDQSSSISRSLPPKLKRLRIMKIRGEMISHLFN